MTPYSPNNPALDSIEELSYVGFTEVVAPSPYTRLMESMSSKTVSGIRLYVRARMVSLNDWIDLSL
nr:hypothetical protein [Paenibacillus alvei]